MKIAQESLKLEKLEWKEFIIGELFEVSGTTTTHPSQLQNGGTTPRITCASTNNGLDDTYKNTPTEQGGVLSLDSATIGFVAYQENDFIATDHVEKIAFKNNKTMSRYVGLAIKLCIDSAIGKKYGYGYKFSQTRIKRQIIKLPTDSEGNPNWEFMENYMRNLEHKHLEKITAYYEAKLAECKGGGG